MPSRPTDPIRDPELTRERGEAVLALLEDAMYECDPDLYKLAKSFRNDLRAALQEDPPVRRYSLEEISERLLGEAEKLHERAGNLYREHRPSADSVQAGANALRDVAEKRLATAFDGATPTQPDQQTKGKP